MRHEARARSSVKKPGKCRRSALECEPIEKSMNCHSITAAFFKSSGFDSEPVSLGHLEK
jgi:hypothetical protein